MKIHEKIAFFDFCETLVNFQTADAFVDYIRKSCGSKKRMFFWNIIRIVMVRTRIIYYLTKFFPKKSIHKRLILFQLKGYKDTEIDKYAYNFYIECIRPNFIIPVINELERLQKDERYRIVIVSGGYDVYLKYFAQEYNIDLKDVVSTKIKFDKNGFCCGVFNGIDCLWDNKVSLLSKKYERKAMYSIAFSDSKTDIPLLEWVDKGIVVSRMGNKSWNTNNKYEDIVW